MSSNRTLPTELVTDQMRRQYKEDGYFILYDALSSEQLELLRSGVSYAMHKVDAALEAAGKDRGGINAKGRRYFGSMLHREELPELRQFLFSPLMAEICRATLGEQAYMFREQYVIKGADPDTSFAWHQDSGYVHENHDPYLTCWIALDDITDQNGPVFLLPYSRSGIRSYVKHSFVPELNDRVCYFGRDPGMPVIIPAGSMAVFSSVVIHRSGPNLTDRLRRVYVAQYSSGLIPRRDPTQEPEQLERFLRDGEIVATP